MSYYKKKNIYSTLALTAHVSEKHFRIKKEKKNHLQSKFTTNTLSLTSPHERGPLKYVSNGTQSKPEKFRCKRGKLTAVWLPDYVDLRNPAPECNHLVKLQHSLLY